MYIYLCYINIMYRKFLPFLIIIFIFGTFSVRGSMLTHGEAAFIIVKYAKFFEYDNDNIQGNIRDSEYINSINNDAVQFLNRHGIMIDPLFVEMKKIFTIKDMKRVLGQIHLLHEGKSVKIKSKIILPKGYLDWNEFCIVNNLNPKKCLLGLEQLNKVILNNPSE